MKAEMRIKLVRCQPELRSSGSAAAGVAQATCLCRAATSRAERKGAWKNSKRSFPKLPPSHSVGPVARRHRLVACATRTNFGIRVQVRDAEQRIGWVRLGEVIVLPQ